MMAKEKIPSKGLLSNESLVAWLKPVVEKTKGYSIVLTVVAIILAVVIAVIMAIIAVNIPSWPNSTGFNGKTAWDLADLLLVPLVLAIIAIFFNKWQKERDIELAEQQKERDREIARERAQEIALQNYLDKMTELLLPPNDLRKIKEDREVRSIARARTLTVLRSLGKRKGSVVQFLYEARLIYYGDEHKPIDTVVNLSGADLRKVILKDAYLGGANLQRANLHYANLQYARLYYANLQYAKLNNANLSEANLRNAVLNYADLRNAVMRGANLYNAFLVEVDLRGAKLNGADLRGANLRDADLTDANLSDATFSEDTIWPKNFDPVKSGARSLEKTLASQMWIDFTIT